MKEGIGIDKKWSMFVIPKLIFVAPPFTGSEITSAINADATIKLRLTVVPKGPLIRDFARNPAGGGTSGQISSSFLRKQESSILFEGSGLPFPALGRTSFTGMTHEGRFR